jgi:hypothetical protein
MQMGLVIILVLLVAQYWAVNFSGIHFLQSKWDDYAMSGKEIASNAAKEEIVFITGREALPQEVFYAGRNIRYATSIEDAKQFLKERNFQRGVVFEEKQHTNGSSSSNWKYLEVQTKIDLRSDSAITSP